MDAQRWNRIGELFEAASHLGGPEREAFLREACGGDDALRRDVVALLASDENTHSLLDGTALDAADLLGELSMDGQRVGPYRVVRQVGVGGMGNVYLAERADGAFEQRVALKLIKHGMDSEQILRRFRGERQILAHLQHPHIARLLDGGLTDDGRPYFAMEYVEGEPIDDYCDRHRLSIDERLSLFTVVCQTVTYAHQHLVVHRDLKPDNILVTPDRTVKLLDFGIAKVLGDDADGLTRTAMPVMTPEYASPEQVRGDPASTSTDIYSLGVVLYELLAGVRPYALPERGPAEVARVVLSTEPSRPSTTVRRGTTGSSDTSPEAISQARKTQPERLERRLAGDLDTICLKALRKEPERRYDSASALADDIHRHLGGLPVLARPDSGLYRARKFVLRHRAGVMVTGAVVLLVAALVSFYTGQLKQERDRARLEATKAEQVAAFLQGIFETSDPAESRGETVTARALLDEGARRLEAELSGQPQVQASMMQVIGNVYGSLGLYAEAESLLTASLALHRGLHEGAHEAVASSLNDVAVAYHVVGRYAEADSLYREALRMREVLHGPNHPEVASAYYNWATLLHFTGEYDLADSLYRRALAVQRRVLEPDDPAVASTLNEMGTLADEQGDLMASDSLYREALALRRARLGESHPDVAASLHNVGIALRHQGRFDEAEPFYLEALALRTKLFGEEHADVAHTLNHLGRLYGQRGDPQKGEPFARRALAIRTAIYGEEHPEVTASMGTLAGLLSSMEDHEGALFYYTRARDLVRASLGPDHPYVAGLTYSIGAAYQEMGEAEQAAAHFRESLALNRSILPADHPNMAYILIRLGVLLANRPDAAACVDPLREALRIREQALPEGHWQVAVAESSLGFCLTALRRHDEAEPLLVSSHQTLHDAFGADDRRVRIARERLDALREAAKPSGR